MDLLKHILEGLIVLGLSIPVLVLICLYRKNCQIKRHMAHVGIRHEDEVDA